jgi:hypothetical protein
MEGSRLARFAPLTGVIWVVLFVVAFLLGGDTPDDDSSAAKVVHYWTTHKSDQDATAIIAAFGLLFFIWFAASLRDSMRRAEGGDDRLASISFAGAVIFATGLFIVLSIQLAVTDTLGDVSPQVTQSLFLVSDEIFLPYIAGTFLFLAPVGLLALRARFLPAWAGWVTILIAVLCITPIGFFGWLLGMLWILPISIVLYRRGARPAAPASPAPAV